MKKMMILQVLALLLSVPGWAQEAARVNESLAGEWEIASRYCSDGSQPNDRFVTDQGKMTLTVVDTKIGVYDAVLYVELADDYFSSMAIFFDPNHNEVVFENSDAVLARDAYRQIGPDQLTIVSSGFGEGGSCATGQELYTVFHRIH